MQRLQAFQYKLMPTGEQQRLMRRFAEQGLGVAESALRARREKAGLCRIVQAAHQVAQQHRYPVAGGGAHGEVFGEIRPASTIAQVSALASPEFWVEIEVSAIVSK